MFCTVDLRTCPSRSRGASVAVGNLIYTFGGRKEECVHGGGGMEVFVFNTVSFQSTALRKSNANDTHNFEPLNRSGHTAVLYKKKIYIWGGRVDEYVIWENVMQHNAVCCFDVTTMTWSQPVTSGESPSCRFDHRACVVGHQMYIFGGVTNSLFVDHKLNFSVCVVPVLDLETMDWQHISTRGNLPHYIYKHSLVVDGCFIYCLGVSDHYTSCVIFCLDTGSNRWDIVSHSCSEVCKPLSNISGYMCVFVHKKDIYILNKSSTESEWVPLRYSVHDGTWNILTLQGQLRGYKYYFSLAQVEDKVFLFGQDVGSLLATMHSIEKAKDPKTCDILQTIDDHYGSFTVLDLNLSLRTLCMLKIIKYKMDTRSLPNSIQYELALMCARA